MDKDLTKIQIKMKALGLSEQKIQAIIKDGLGSKHWNEMSRGEKKQLLQSLEKRIIFARKFIKFLTCGTVGNNNCWCFIENHRLAPQGSARLCSW